MKQFLKIFCCIFLGSFCLNSMATTPTETTTSDASDVLYYIEKAQSTIKQALSKTEPKDITELAKVAWSYCGRAESEADDINNDDAESECSSADYYAEKAYRSYSVKEAKEYLNKAYNELSSAKRCL